MIPFNKPYMTGAETEYIRQAVASGHISGDGLFTKKCHRFFEEKYGFKKALLTTSCTDSLEMAAILTGISPGDEVIMPSFTFVSTANAFVLRGAKIVFADSSPESPNIDASKLEALLTPKTKAIVVVHYAGVACDMDQIMALAAAHNLFVIEDAAHATESFYKGRPLGSIGHLATFSFHETKNIISGEGGMLAINDNRFLARAEIIREKGTNRSAFFRGEVAKYSWVDVGSSFLPSDIIAAFLWAQLETLESIQQRRMQLWQLYHNGLKPLETAGKLKLPVIPAYATNNANMFYLVCKSPAQRTALINYLREAGVWPVFHYLPLHKSDFYIKLVSEIPHLPYCDYYSECLLRLPFYYELAESDQVRIIELISAFFSGI